MDWDALIKAYPDEKDTIQAARSLRERIYAAFASVDIPAIAQPPQSAGDLDPFVPCIASVCEAVWRDLTGHDPGFDMPGSISALLKGGDAGHVPEADRNRLEAVARQVVSRFLSLLRAKNPSVIPEAWNRGDCPFCGELARIGYDDESGRKLACLACGHTWRIPRLRCPSCGNADHTKLGYFEADGIEGVRVYFCRECARYLKVVDARVRVPSDAETDDSLTLELDRLAEKEGFS